MSEAIVALIPARAGSERVKYKNTRPFAEFKNGLLELKLRQLVKVKEISKIIVSTNDPIVSAYATHFGKSIDGRVKVIDRPDELGRSSTPMSAFIRYAASLEDSGTMLMTHVTHPFITSSVFSELISAWHAAKEKGHDSLVTVTKLHKFIWDENGPYNYDNSVEKWPRSQDIKPLFEINHAAYFMPFSRMREVGDRIGNNPDLYELPESIAMDIDWEDQFKLLEDIAAARLSRGIDLL
ncbi:acylneuraminate cytidylyltransferase family protein [Halomonas sp. R1t8]|uniref:acylneuraminate cytidylyltransferase family protein n=1 Tax=unclassified Halomonas TaxID=2609666 RepID=UPI00209D2F97|nr:MULTISPECIES: acylneuraminate cytidylyltransferase family protein [unclassified Halomonas]MCP1304862.1 acylneuraminate cytidylyltransferase family protein [Halomonas sp. R1t8]MCP1331809.1 acylneuraminate cytidylyltransferase family protein [Halomonas sp. R1t4]